MLPVTRRPVVVSRRIALVAGAALLLLAACAGTASAKTAAQAIQSINALRVANGIPALTGDARLSAACQLHARYMKRNGGWDQDRPHGEKRSNPGYTVRGARAAERSVLAATGWFAPNPWASAPVHLAQVLDPALRRTGYGQESTFICLDTMSARRRQTADLLTYPGPGATGVAPAMTAAEVSAQGALSTPGMRAGIRAGARTGPYIILFTRAALVSIDAASLTGPAGPVPVAVSGSFVIPRVPLAARTAYAASVSVTTAGGARIQRDWRFVTGATVPDYATPTLALDIRLAARARGSASAPKLAISARGAALGRRVTLRVRNLRRVCRPRCSTRRVGPTTTARLRLAGLRRVSLPRLTRGDTGWSVSVTAQGFSRDGVRYRAYNVTRTIRPR